MKHFLVMLLLAFGFASVGMSLDYTVSDDAKTKIVVSSDYDVGVIHHVEIDNLTVFNSVPIISKGQFVFSENTQKAILFKAISFISTLTDYRALMYRHEQLSLTAFKTQASTDSNNGFRRARDGLRNGSMC